MCQFITNKKIQNVKCKMNEARHKRANEKMNKKRLYCIEAGINWYTKYEPFFFRPSVEFVILIDNHNRFCFAIFLKQNIYIRAILLCCGTFFGYCESKNWFFYDKRILRNPVEIAIALSFLYLFLTLLLLYIFGRYSSESKKYMGMNLSQTSSSA